jgi:FMN phosphatase YigB (HAD superfamily)
MLRHLLARERCGRGQAVLVEDSRANLKAAHALGVRTVLLARGAVRRAGRPTYVGARIGSLHQLPRALARLRR